MRSAGKVLLAEGCSLLVAKENQKTTSDFDALEPRKRGYSPLLTPKGWATPEKTEDLLTVFSGSADSKPLSRCATAPPRGSGHARSAALSQKAALQMPFPSMTPPVKMGYRKVRVCVAMKAPVGLLSGRAVCVSRWRGFAPTSSADFPVTRNLKSFFR